MTKTIENYDIKIEMDDFCENPRNWSNVTKMVCFHNRYTLGDKHQYNHKNYNGWNELKNAIIKTENVHTILPLYLYDHSALSISTNPFSCKWDSGQIGFVFITNEVVNQEELKESNINTLIQGEVQTYNQYISGEVYKYQIFKDDIMIDECCGYYDKDECMDAAKDIVDGLVSLDIEKRIASFSF